MKNKLIILIVLIAAIGGSLWYWKHHKQEVQQQAQQASSDVPAINGLPVNKGVASTRPLAVVIENSIDARPQSGLYFADIVYETLAEGGITRMLALYQTQNPKEIGPIRSARPYFNQLADQWHAAYAHVGGSSTALSELDSNTYKNLTDINQFSFGDYFYRSQERVTPHNAYSSTELLRALIEKKKWQTWQPRQLGQFETIPTEKLQNTITSVNVKFFAPGYTENFKFNTDTALYDRITGGVKAVDKINNMQISPRNVLVEFVDDYVVPLTPANGLGLHLDEDGRALLFTGGNVTDGTWRYKDGFTQYIYTDDQGQTQNMKFQPGQTWIILMPKSLTNNVTWQ